ncbi:MAG: hypothetical protein K8S97_04365 [Anaerolineae bacterium]|nr:hypothetical protein [Anaerolineae bacterium]
MLGAKQRLPLHRVGRVFILATLMLALIPVGHTSAGPVNYIAYSAPVLDCVAGTVVIQIDYVIHMGYTLSSEETISSPSLGTTTTTYSQVVPADWEHHGLTLYWGVPADGTYSYAYAITDPGGTLLSTARFVADCTSNNITVINWDHIPGVLPPPPTARATGSIQVDVPVFAEPSPDAALPNHILRAGQSWFVVGSTTDANGMVWYEIFTYGPHNGFVPAWAVTVQGDVPQ